MTMTVILMRCMTQKMMTLMMMVVMEKMMQIARGTMLLMEVLPIKLWKTQKWKRPSSKLLTLQTTLTTY